jgi:hypothetical protein
VSVNAEIENWFIYHPPVGDQQARYTQLREQAKQFAYTLLELCPPSADRTAALRKLRECVMTANASIARYSPWMEPGEVPMKRDWPTAKLAGALIAASVVFTAAAYTLFRLFL